MTKTWSERHGTSEPGVDSGHRRLWRTMARAASAAWIAVAVTQTPPGPLSRFLLGLSLSGGLLAARTPRMSAGGARRFVVGFLSTAAAVLVIVGIGHHVVAGLVSVAALAATSPALARRIVRREIWASTP